ncbi:hypothetical protein VTN00DRAFT_467 [Thermoascus crustaceus]|uniref:uncharacterized protein n=1 Tax=Thermoascus crustaceus TaxID=5088 RepID=UPI003744575A
MASEQSAQQQRPLSSFRLLSFDIYGTLVDWETGIYVALEPLHARLPDAHPLKSDFLALGARFSAHEQRIQAARPEQTYDLVLRDTYVALARELDATPTTTDGTDAEDALKEEGERFASSVAHWPAFPDTVSAMRRLRKLGYKLVPISNVDRASFSKTLLGPLAGLHEPFSPDGPAIDPFFDAIYTAQDIGSYKPDLRNFEYLISHAKVDFGVEKHEILHVAQSLVHDHVPAKEVGLESVWIARGDRDGGESGMGGGRVEEFLREGKVAFGWRFGSLGEFVDKVEEEREIS